MKRVERMNIEVYKKIKQLADEYAAGLKDQINSRIEEMKSDDTSHYLLYTVLGITKEEGNLIDLYQNKGRFLYKYAGAFLENAAMLCIKDKFPDAHKTSIQNTLSIRPKTFEIDCLVDNLAHEIKWRDATTDGDHITKEHTRVKVISDNGYIPIRVMFYYPQRTQAQKIQDTLKTLYHGVGGQYYYGDSAWKYMEDFTGINLLEILECIAQSRK
jgi:type II restriction enzyme